MVFAQKGAEKVAAGDRASGTSRESQEGGDDYLSALGEAGEVTGGGPAAGMLPAAVLARFGMPALAALVFLAVAVACWVISNGDRSDQTRVRARG